MPEDRISEEENLYVQIKTALPVPPSNLTVDMRL